MYQYENNAVLLECSGEKCNLNSTLPTSYVLIYKYKTFRLSSKNIQKMQLIVNRFIRFQQIFTLDENFNIFEIN